MSLEENSLESINPSIISQLVNLERLSLSQNNLNSLDWKALTQLNHLNKLLLDSNSFQTIPDYVESTFHAVHELTLAGNPLHCNCKLKWLKEFYDTTSDKLLDYDSVECVSPHKLRMVDTFQEDYDCSKPSQPLIHFYELSDYQYIINCSSMADPAPTLTLHLPEQRKLVTPPSDDLSELRTRSPRILSKGGDVICIASNTEGSTTTIAYMPTPGNHLYILHYNDSVTAFVISYFENISISS